jgi:putative acetyltransferase
MFTIRAENSNDIHAIQHVVEAAFGRTFEARLVEVLRQADALIASLVAVEEERVVGHIGFSAVVIESQDITMNAVALAPLAVLPAYQCRGIGGELVRRGVEECKGAGHRAVLVLGEPAFYQRFGFIKASLRGVTALSMCRMKRYDCRIVRGRAGRTRWNGQISPRIRLGVCRLVGFRTRLERRALAPFSPYAEPSGRVSQP